MVATTEATHEAMATTFDLRLCHDEPAYARKAAKEAFAQIDRLEAQLSRFSEGSDVWRINHVQELTRLRVSEECHRCLLTGLRMMELTGGAFDMTMGAAAEQVRQAGGATLDTQALLAALEARAGAVFRIDPEVPQVEVCGFNGALDLGAIGKGFALDCVAELLGQWEIGHFMLNAGGSSLLVRSVDEAWEMNLRGESRSVPVRLRSGALGASGTTVRGRHIINAFSAGQDYRHVRAWAIAPTAAEADALSTAWMTLDTAQIAQVLERAGEGYAALIENASGEISISDAGRPWRDAGEQPEGWLWG